MDWKWMKNAKWRMEQGLKCKLKEWRNERLKRKIKEMKRVKKERKKERMNKWMNGWMNQSINQWKEGRKKWGLRKIEWRMKD
jgi:hypothetical protein